MASAVYGVPLFRGQVSLFYNLDMFKAAGLTKPPATMDEYNSYAEKLTQRDASGKATVSGWSMRLSGGGQGVAEKFWINLFQYGGNILTQTADGKWKSTLAGEAGRKALKQYLVNIHKTKTVTPEMPADAEAFERGQTAMFIRESWVIGDIAKKAPNLAYATAPLPRGSMSVPVNLYVAAKGAEADAGWAFAMAADEPDNQLWLLKNVGWLPNRAGLDTSAITAAVPAFSSFVNNPKGYDLFAVPAIDVSDEVLTRVAAKLVAAFADRQARRRRQGDRRAAAGQRDRSQRDPEARRHARQVTSRSLRSNTASFPRDGSVRCTRLRSGSTVWDVRRQMLERKKWIFAILALAPILAIYAAVRLYPIGETLRLSLLPMEYPVEEQAVYRPRQFSAS